MSWAYDAAFIAPRIVIGASIDNIQCFCCLKSKYKKFVVRKHLNSYVLRVSVYSAVFRRYDALGRQQNSCTHMFYFIGRTSIKTLALDFLDEKTVD
jgi:hypothetical protein